MKNFVKIIALALVLVLSVSVLAACGGSIKGKWEYTEEGMTMVYDFGDDEYSVYLKDDPDFVLVSGKYEVKGNKLIIEEDGEKFEGEFKISGDKLTLINDGEDEIVLKKAK